ncbi:MAG: hypothetical protein K2G51_04255 [Lachnospiraceae bacterium]|nr:hypothetical protein [Lachnospiraceae bacterium]
MFAILFVMQIICGILLLYKAKNTLDKNGLNAIFAVSGVILIVYGVVQIYYVITGVIELPLW